MASNTNEEDDIDYDEIEQVQETKEDENNYVKKWAALFFSSSLLDNYSSSSPSVLLPKPGDIMLECTPVTSVILFWNQSY
jgi:hypothetical protein